MIALYARIRRGHSGIRKPDPHIVTAIWRALDQRNGRSQGPCPAPPIILLPPTLFCIP